MSNYLDYFEYNNSETHILVFFVLIYTLIEESYAKDKQNDYPLSVLCALLLNTNTRAYSNTIG